VKKEFIPACFSNDESQLEIFCKRTYDNFGFEATLRSLSIGEIVAVKVGKQKLKQHVAENSKLPPQTHISSLVIVASQLGIVPCVELLNRVLGDPRSSIDAVEVLWINSAAHEFFLDEEMDNLEQKYQGRLVVTRVVDEAADEPGTEINKRISGSITFFDNSQSCIIMSPPNVIVEKAKKCLMKRGFPTSSISELILEK
jgi:hypothetical protein